MFQFHFRVYRVRHQYVEEGEERKGGKKDIQIREVARKGMVKKRGVPHPNSAIRPLENAWVGESSRFP